MVLTSTLTTEYKPTGADATCASQIEFTTLQGEITTIQEQMIALGIATLVNGVLTAVTDSIQAGAVATALAKCMKLSGTQTLTQLNTCIISVPTNFTTLTLNNVSVATTNQTDHLSHSSMVQ